MILLLLLQLAGVLAHRVGEPWRDFWCKGSTDDLARVAEELVEEITRSSNCTVFVTDSIVLQDREDFSRPREPLRQMLQEAKTAGSNGYVILLANGILAAEFLRYADGERLINTRGLFLLLHDNRLFRADVRYLWERIVNVVFIRRYTAYERRSGEAAVPSRIDLETIYYPSGKRTAATKFIDSWHSGRFRYGNNHYPEKVSDLQGKSLRVAVFEHIPGITEKSRAFYGARSSRGAKGLGIEFELIQVLAKALNFRPKYYMPHDIAMERWGTRTENGSYTGLLREVVERRATFYIGDLHYTPRHINNFDLTIPYNTECLTFLTPESLTENSWKLLILPFRLYTWIALLVTLVVAGASFHLLCLLYKRKILPERGEENRSERTKGMYLFTELQNSVLYTYGMLFQVSLPRLPGLLAVRVLIGWWWVYSILVAVAYRASMTAALANPVTRVRIDALSELAKASIKVGGWSDETKDFFLTSSDLDSQEIGNRFELVKHEEEAIERVANGSFCYYENVFLLTDARVKRQVRLMQNNSEGEEVMKHNLHIMEECVVHMPIALGLEKNSPLKPHVDTWVPLLTLCAPVLRRIIEAGLVEKWLSDVMEWSKITEIQEDSESKKALVDLRKLQGAFIVLGGGYFLGFLALIGEIIYWKTVVLRDPRYDKYHLDLFYINDKGDTVGS